MVKLDKICRNVFYIRPLWLNIESMSNQNLIRSVEAFCSHFAHFVGYYRLVIFQHWDGVQLELHMQKVLLMLVIKFRFYIFVNPL